MDAAVPASRSAVAVAVLVAVVLLGGCTSEPPAEEEPSPTPPTTPAAPERTEVTPTPTPTPTEDEEVTADETDPDIPRRGDAIAVLEGAIEGVRAEITKLARTGPQVVELEIVVVNEAGMDVRRIHGFALDGGVRQLSDDYGSAAGIALVDAVNARRHYVLRDGEGRCVCSPDVELLPRGARLPVYASFPAPPDDVGELTVQVPGFGTIVVPLS